MSTVVVYDSGVGGLSISQEFRKLHPYGELIFVSDNEAFPYGTKDDLSLYQRVLAVSSAVVEHYAPDVMVVACNTASTVMLPKLREVFDCEIVGVVPAIKPAAQLSRSKVIGILATPATIKRAYTAELIQQFASDFKIVSIGSSKLVELAESKLAGEEVELLQIEDQIKPILESAELDVLVLACTHFPLLKDELDQVLVNKGLKITMIDSGAAIARRIVSLLPSSEDEENNVAVFTAQPKAPDAFLDSLNVMGFSEIELLHVE